MRITPLATSYGLLGLHSASLCGIKVDKSHWRSAANHFVTDQNRGGPLTKLARYDYDRFRTNRPTPALKFPATGWSNRAATETPADSPTWGSATCAGIASLAIAEKGMGERGKTTAVRLASKARHCGLAWLALNMTTRVHPGAMSQRTTGIYDYLCALEQAAGLSGLIHISERDWYFEGAMSLMLTQNPDGTWPADHAGKSPIDNTAKAVLFLAHGTMPALRKS